VAAQRHIGPRSRGADGPDRRGATIWFTGLPGAGKTTLADACAAALRAAGQPATVLDGDDLRGRLNADLGFSAADRQENVRRIGEVARLFAESGMVSLVSVVSPYRAGREHARRAHHDDGLAFVEVHVATPLAVCESRDPKGLYARARNGRLADLTGVDAPYEEPLGPDAQVVLDGGAVDAAVARVLTCLERRRRSSVSAGPDQERGSAPFSRAPAGRVDNRMIRGG
jgi:bifunctional enzyme CysN/CysC